MVNEDENSIDSGYKLKRGDEVMVSNIPGCVKSGRLSKRIYLGTIEGAQFPYITVSKYHNHKYYKGETFCTNHWRYMEPISKDEGVEMTIEQKKEEL